MKTYYLILLILGAIGATSCSETNKGANLTASNTTAINTANTNSAKPESTPTSVAMSGEDLYKKNCAACHKETGTGGKVTIEGRTINPDNLVSDRKKNAPDDKFHNWIANGNPDEGMPAFKEKLSDQDIDQIVQYIRTGLQKK
jgi:mono/diheme cytochrome c family protein